MTQSASISALPGMDHSLTGWFGRPLWHKALALDTHPARAAALQGLQLSGCTCPAVFLTTVSCCLQLFHDSGSGVPYGPKWATGDIVGAGWNLQRQEMFFT